MHIYICTLYMYIYAHCTYIYIYIHMVGRSHGFEVRTPDINGESPWRAEEGNLFLRRVRSKHQNVLIAKWAICSGYFTPKKKVIYRGSFQKKTHSKTGRWVLVP